jgi:hypothetical protein
MQTRNLDIVFVVTMCVVHAFKCPLSIFSHIVIKNIYRLLAIKTSQPLFDQERDNKWKVHEFVFIILVFLYVLHLVTRYLVLYLAFHFFADFFYEIQ